MRVKSRAGSFNLTIDEVGTENGELVLVGKMGVWEAKTYLSAEELREMLATLKIETSVLDFFALVGFRYLRRLRDRDETHAALALVTGSKTQMPAGG
ncbi:MAG TPA: hypothetical protein VLF14_03760 [Candidatus Binatia bacterium]|nr:hypothetical protein [Candidatus Binatia bacterium]